MAKKNKTSVTNGSVFFGSETEVDEMQNNHIDSQTQAEKPKSIWSGLGRGERIVAIAVCLLLVIGALGAGGEKIISVFKIKNTKQETNQPAQNNGSLLSALNPFVEPPLPTSTPQLSKEYIYAGSRMLAVEDANASAATPTPTPASTPVPTPTPGNGCTPTTTVTEGDLFPGGIPSFGVSSGAGSVTVDHVNAGSGLQSFTVVGVPTNAAVNIPAFPAGTYNPVVETYTITNPNLPVDFTLRAASQFHGIFIRVRCSSVVNTFSGRATSVNATINGVNATLNDTGPLPAMGGNIERSLASGNVLGGALTTGLLNATTQGAGDQSRSQAQVENLNLTTGGNIITGDLVPASSQCTCTTGGPVCVGGIYIANLRVNGAQIAIVDGAVNQTVNLPGGGTLIYNEQTRTGAGNTASLTVNGVHVTTAEANVIISSAQSGIVCATP